MQLPRWAVSGSQVKAGIDVGAMQREVAMR
jgi:hypothetical protein